MMMRPPLFICFSAACVATNTPRTLMSSTRSISSSVVSSNVFGMAVPALFTRTSSLPKVGHCLFDGGLDGLGIGGVRLNRDRLSAVAFNLLNNRRGRIGAFRVCDGHVRPVCGQTFGDGGANAARAAGDRAQFFLPVFYSWFVSCFFRGWIHCVSIGIKLCDGQKPVKWFIYLSV